MRKPEGYDNAPAITGGGNRLPAGGYICQILGVELTASRAGAEMLNLYFDIAQGDYAGYFREGYERNKQFGSGMPKWPNSGTIRQLTEGKQVGRFKGLIFAIEKCNPGWHWNWNEQELKGKKLGIVLREEEYIGNRDGKVHTSLSVYGYYDLESVLDVEVPPIKKLAGAPSGNGDASFPGDADYVPNIADEEIPF